MTSFTLNSNARTHTASLVVLVAALFLVVGFVNTAPAEQSHSESGSNDNLAPSQRMAAVGVPDSFPVPSDVKIHSITYESNQRQVTFTTNQSQEQLVSTYQSWVRSAGMDNYRTDTADRSVAVLASGQTSRAIVVVSDLSATNQPDRREVQLNYMTTN